MENFTTNFNIAWLPWCCVEASASQSWGFTAVSAPCVPIGEGYWSGMEPEAA